METRPVPAPPTPAPPRVSFDRWRWESAVLASSLPRFPRMVALILAHHADAVGYLPAGGFRQESKNLAAEARIDSRTIRRVLNELEGAGWIHRPDSTTWPNPTQTRPITLTLPSAAAARVPPHTGGAHE